jgi:hypothetical protein
VTAERAVLIEQPAAPVMPIEQPAAPAMLIE